MIVSSNQFLCLIDKNNTDKLGLQKQLTDSTKHGHVMHCHWKSAIKDLFACWPASRLGFAIYLAKIILKKKGGKTIRKAIRDRDGDSVVGFK